MTRKGLLLSIAAVFVGNAAPAQYPVRPVYRPGYVNPYNPYYAGGTTYANISQANATIMAAQGQSLQAQQSARVTGEQANQAALDTRKKAFDQMLYEKSHTLSYGEQVMGDKMKIISRMMDNPIRSEIVNGTTLNVLLPHLQALATYGAMGPPVPIAQSKINELNIAGTGSTSVGVLRGGGQVDWPIGLRGPQQKQLDKLLPAACDAVVKGTLDAKLMKQIRTEMKTMREGVAKQLQREEIEPSTYFQATAFYSSLESAVNALEKPDARKQLTGGYAVRARNVQELVDYMIDNGLKFAAASPGSEPAYHVVHDAFVRYARTAQASSGFQPLHTAAKSPGAKK